MILDILPGSKIYKNDKISILAGCPPEIIKFVINKKLDFPEYIILPDDLFKGDVIQCATEFPLYYHLFVLGKLFQGKKLNILGTKSTIYNNRELLRLTLLGPTKEEYNEIGNSPYFNELYNESRYLAVKNKEGKELQIDDFVNFIPFGSNVVEIGDTIIKHVDKNVYEINGEILDINFNEPQYPPYDIKFDFVPMAPHKFGLDILGGGSGFTPTKPCSGVLLNYNSEYMLIDCLPYLDYHLRARGLSRNQIKSIYLTHIHDDHCNIFPLVKFSHKMTFLGTKEIYWMALKKLSLQTGHNFEEFYSYFDFVELTPYKENYFYGINIIPHYTVHSIPTIGATFKMKDKNKIDSIVFVGDNKSIPDIKKMVDLGVTKEDKYRYLWNIYRDRSNLLLADGGMGILHGNPEDSLESKSDKVVFLHLEKLPEKFDATFSMAEAGKRYITIDSKNDAYTIKAQEIFHNSFPDISPEWINALMSNMNLSLYNSGDVVLKQGEKRKGNIYIILSGVCAVVYHDGKVLKEIAVKETGDFIGEMAIVKRTKIRSASVVAKTPVILGVIDEEVYYMYLKNENKIKDMMNIWEMRHDLEKIEPFSLYSDLVNDRIAAHSKLMKVKAGDLIIREGEENSELYIIMEGLFDVILNEKIIKTISKGNLFGEFGYFETKKKTPAIKAKTDGSILEISSINIQQILLNTPSFNFLMNHIIKERKEELFQG